MVIPTITEIQSNMMEDFKSKFSISTILPNSFIYVFCYAVAGALWGAYYYASKIEANLFLDTTTNESTIIRWGEFLGISRKAGSVSEGKIKVTSPISIIDIPIKTTLTSSSGVEYETSILASSNTAELDIDIRAKEIGVNNNLSANTQLIFQSPINGVDTVATVVVGGVVGGSDVEDVEDYRIRLLGAISNIRSGGSKSDYEAWSLEIEGVFKVFIFENYGEVGKVGVGFVTNDRENLIPNEQLRGKLQNHIDELRPLGADVSVFIPTEKSVDLRINIEPDTTSIRDNVTNQLNEMFKRNAEVGGVVYASRISEAISISEGEESHELIGFSDFTLDLGNKEIAVLGNITWS